MPIQRHFSPPVRPPPGQVVQRIAYQYGQIAVINADGSYYVQQAAGWQWSTTNAAYLPPAAFLDPSMPMLHLAPPGMSQPWAENYDQPIQPGRPLPQWIGWQPVSNMPTPPVLPAPRQGLLRRLLGGGG